MDQWNLFRFFDKSYLRLPSQPTDVDQHDGLAVSSRCALHRRLQQPLDQYVYVQCREITCSTSCGGHLIFGDAQGYLSLMSRDASMTAFKAHNAHVAAAAASKRSDLCVTVGDGAVHRSPDEAQAASDIAADAMESAMSRVRAAASEASLTDSQAREKVLAGIGQPTQQGGALPTGNAGPATLRVWNLAKCAEDGTPSLLLSLRVFPVDAGADNGKGAASRGAAAAPAASAQRGGDPAAACSVAINEAGDVIAVGCSDGRVVLFKGDLMRARGKTVREEVPPPPSARGGGATSVTYLGFAESSDSTTIAQAYRGAGGVMSALRDVSRSHKNVLTLFVTTENSVRNIIVGGSITLSVPQCTRDLGSGSPAAGARAGCAVVNSEGRLAVANTAGVFFFTPESPSAAYAVSGFKVFVASFRRYLVVVSRGAALRHAVWVYDAANKLAVFNHSLASSAGLRSMLERGSRGAASTNPEDWAAGKGPPASDLGGVRNVLAEWGRLHIITGSGVVMQLREHDTPSKLDMLFRLNRFDIAIQLASTSGYDASSIVDIFRAYGDHLHKKTAFAAAMEQFLVTIGHVEPSYVIRKFLDAPRIHELTRYLELLHALGHATEGHTTLLLNCYTKLRDTAKLQAFIRGDVKGVPPRLPPTVAAQLEKLQAEGVQGGKNPVAVLGVGTGAGSDVEQGGAGGPNFHVDAAIAVLRDAGFAQEALYLAGRHGKHVSFVQLLMDMSASSEGSLYAAVSDALPADGAEAEGGEGGVKSPSRGPLHTALEYMCRLPFLLAERLAFTHGKALLGGLGAPARELLQQLCTGYTPVASKEGSSLEAYVRFPVDDSGTMTVAEPREYPQDAGKGGVRPATPRADPEGFIPIFAEHPEQGRLFLEYVVKHAPMSPQAVWDTLLHLSLSTHDEDRLLADAVADSSAAESRNLSAPSTGALASGAVSMVAAGMGGQHLQEHEAEVERQRHRRVLRNILANPSAKYDAHHALSLCRTHDYNEGALFLLEKAREYSQVLCHHADAATAAALRGDEDGVRRSRSDLLATCQRFGGSEPQLWVAALHFVVDAYGGPMAGQAGEEDAAEITDLFDAILDHIDQEALLSPVQVVNIVARNEACPLSLIATYISDVLKGEKRMVKAAKKEIATLSAEIEEVEAHEAHLRSSLAELETRGSDALIERELQSATRQGSGGGDGSTPVASGFAILREGLPGLSKQPNQTPGAVLEMKRDHLRHVTSSSAHEAFFRQLGRSAAIVGTGGLGEFFQQGWFDDEVLNGAAASRE